MIQENSNGLIIAEKALREKEALYEKHLSNANDTLEGLSKAREDLVKKLAEIQAQIQEVDAKMTKLKKPFEKFKRKRQNLEINCPKSRKTNSKMRRISKGFKKKNSKKSTSLKASKTTKFNSKIRWKNLFKNLGIKSR
ncbi:hypothetical protein PIB30_057832 [Stylosanthes scabra]|uniref:Uncharacterized protein n=1 Tax=Stylosanthes scabra TaxID=79078 RepID=A0ABU6TLW6_9FABA|nr:hypothetical protein [Stylosanthes scabra]